MWSLSSQKILYLKLESSRAQRGGMPTIDTGVDRFILKPGPALLSPKIKLNFILFINKIFASDYIFTKSDNCVKLFASCTNSKKYLSRDVIIKELPGEKIFI